MDLRFTTHLESDTLIVRYGLVNTTASEVVVMHFRDEPAPTPSPFVFALMDETVLFWAGELPPPANPPLPTVTPLPAMVQPMHGRGQRVQPGSPLEVVLRYALPLRASFSAAPREGWSVRRARLSLAIHERAPGVPLEVRPDDDTVVLRGPPTYRLEAKAELPRTLSVVAD